MSHFTGGEGEAAADAAAEGTVTEQLQNLMVRYQDGEVEAFDRLYDLLLPPLRAYLTYLTRNPAKAEDLLQETFLQLHRSRRTYRPPRPVKPWAFGIARYVHLMDRRAAGRRSQIFEPPCDLPPDLPIPAEASGLADRDAVQRALAELPPDQQESLLLHHVWGFSFPEIARTLGIRSGAAKVRAHRGMRRLREILAVPR